MSDEATGSKGRVLVVDDAPEFLELIGGLLRKEGYEVHEAVDGTSAVAEAHRHEPDLVVLDLTLPDIDGMEVCRQLREFTDAYVLMLTARDDELDRVLGLKTGADDYVTKPFSPREVAARVEALLRRPRVSTEQQHDDGDDRREFGAVTVHPLAREVEVDGAPVALTRIEFDILDVLSERPRMVHSRAVLRERVWGEDWFGDDHVVDVHIANLRKKIDRGDGPSHVRTVRGVGYRMES
ncbi:response regulator transcription factor [Actinospongicola halichondriae]|uniref:response regulator transcription factor n=1 Tax=Actinospongicola halichondriae TaxID=3236844 RepID=UPI003D439B2C